MTFTNVLTQLNYLYSIICYGGPFLQNFTCTFYGRLDSTFTFFSETREKRLIYILRGEEISHLGNFKK